MINLGVGRFLRQKRPEVRTSSYEPIVRTNSSWNSAFVVVDRPEAPLLFTAGTMGLFGKKSALALIDAAFFEGAHLAGSLCAGDLGSEPRPNQRSANGRSALKRAFCSLLSVA